MIHLDCIWLYDGLHSRPRGNCIDLHGICLLYAVHYTSTHFCGMLILAKRGYIGAMLPKYQDVLCLLAPQCSHNSKDSQQLQNDEPMHKSASPIHKKSVAVELACRVRSCCHQHFPLLQLFPPPCRLWDSNQRVWKEKLDHAGSSSDLVTWGCDYDMNSGQG